MLLAREEIKLLLQSDVEGRYGFNIQGKERNQDEPVIVSRVMSDSPASKAYPTPVMIGDELIKVPYRRSSLLINVTSHDVHLTI